VGNREEEALPIKSKMMNNIRKRAFYTRLSLCEMMNSIE